MCPLDNCISSPLRRLGTDDRPAGSVGESVLVYRRRRMEKTTCSLQRRSPGFLVHSTPESQRWCKINTWQILMPLQWLFVCEPFGCRHSSNRRRLACESLNIPSPALVTAVLIKGRFILRQLGARRHKTNCNTVSPSCSGANL